MRCIKTATVSPQAHILGRTRCPVTATTTRMLIVIKCFEITIEYVKKGTDMCVGIAPCGATMSTHYSSLKVVVGNFTPRQPKVSAITASRTQIHGN